jgi:hypothetical protein
MDRQVDHIRPPPVQEETNDSEQYDTPTRPPLILEAQASTKP